MTTALLLQRGETVSGHPSFLVLWDAILPPAGYEGPWLSLPMEVRQNRVSLRDRYTAWIAACGSSPLQGQSLAERLMIRPDLSYWWLTIPSEYTFAESSFVYCVVRILAFAEWAQVNGITRVESAVHGDAINRTMANWCDQFGIGFARKLSRKRETESPLKGPKLIVSAARRWARAWRDARPDNKSQRTIDVTKSRQENSLLIVDYLAHVAQESGTPRSRYWAHLPDLLRERGAKINWLHLFIPSPLTPTMADARALAAQMAGPGETTAMVQAGFTWSIRLGALFTWVRAAMLYRTFVRHHLDEPLGQIRPWPILREASKPHFFGGQAMDTCLWIGFFDHYLRNGPRFPCGLYLQENQPWELALVSAWQRHGHGHLVGVQHTTIRFWDLRYLKTIGEPLSKPASLPGPELALLNGSAAGLTAEGFRPLGQQVRSAEALRFIDESTKAPVPRPERSGPPRLLVVAEYDPTYAADQVQLITRLKELADERGEPIEIKWRPHPAASVSAGQDLPNRVTADSLTPINESLLWADLALLGDISSTLLQALEHGVEVAVLPSSRILSGEPAQLDDADLVTTPESLLTRLLNAVSNREGLSPTYPPTAVAFHLEKSLPRWSEVLDTLGISRVD